MRHSDIDKKGHFFEDLGSKKLPWRHPQIGLDKSYDNPYMFGTLKHYFQLLHQIDGSNELDVVFAVHRGSMGLDRKVSLMKSFRIWFCVFQQARFD